MSPKAKILPSVHRWFLPRPRAELPLIASEGSPLMLDRGEPIAKGIREHDMCVENDEISRDSASTTTRRDVLDRTDVLGAEARQALMDVHGAVVRSEQSK